MAGLVIALVGGVLFFVSQQVESLTSAKLQQEFQNTQRTFKRFLTLRNDQLIESCVLISELPVLKAQLSTKDPSTLKDYILKREESPAKLVEADLFTLTDERGCVLFRLDRPELHGDTIASMSSIRQALAGKDPAGNDWGIWVIDEKIYQIVSVPIIQKYVIGTLTLGKRLTSEEAHQLKEDTQSDITFLYGNRVVASTLDDISQVDLLRAYVADRRAIEKQIFPNGSVQKNIPLNGENFLAVFTPAAKSGDAVYVMTVSKDKAYHSFDLIKNAIYAAGGAALLLAAMFSFFFARGITMPLKQLVEATYRVRDGNYESAIEVHTKDEFETLARSFNSMLTGLKERMMMTKFVSQSTVKMIRTKGNLQLGGERRTITVLFSDIRGFTSYSEHVEPEVVIELLNKYLSAQSSLVIKYHGIIDKFVGDELVAIFEGEEMANNAVLCALEIQQTINELNKANEEDIRVGIGINTGMAVAGNVGSDERMDHTVLGSNVNLGARLCSIAEAGQVIVAESCQRMATTKDVRFVALDPIKVKGVSRPVSIYEARIQNHS